jgi:hypothetical protein
MLDPQPMLLLGNVLNQGSQVISDLQLIFRRIIEDVKGHLVADTAATQERIRNDSGQDLVQAFVKGFTHGFTWMQRNTYVSLLVVR